MSNYISRLDEIDKWLFDSFGILPGCGCSQENLRHTTARMVAEALWSKNPIEILSKKCKMDETPAPEGIEPIDTSEIIFNKHNMVKICFQCGSAMKLQEGVIYISNPPKYGYTCPVCGAVEYDVERIDNIQGEPIVKDSKISEEIDQNFTKSSDDLEKAAEKYSNSLDYWNYINDDPSIAFVAGANWQKERFEKERLAACDNMTEEEYRLETDLVEKHIKEHNCLPTFADAIKYGMKVQEQRNFEDWLKSGKSLNHKYYEKGKADMLEQMKKEAVDVTVVGEKRDLRLDDSTQRGLFNAKRGDWLKVIILK